jgi:hypothetical protein
MIVSEPRLYLYRKAGREIWDAEMWLPDGQRRVWRTGITDRAEAETAARMRLENLSVPASAASASPTVANLPSEADLQQPALPELTTVLATSRTPAARPTGPADLPPRSQPKVAGASPPAHGWADRFDHWFFGELASLLR